MLGEGRPLPVGKIAALIELLVSDEEEFE